MRYPTKRTTYDSKNEGIGDARKILKSWNSQKNPKKVYVLGKRVHHGTMGSVLWALGLLYNKPYLEEYGKTLMKDDIHDASDWFNFEEGGDKDALLSFV